MNYVVCSQYKASISRWCRTQQNNSGESPMISLQQAVQLIQGQRLEEARTLLTTICKERPDIAQAWLLFSTLNGIQGNFIQAERCAREALRLQPDILGACATLGSALQSQGRAKEAIACFRQALKENPEDCNSYNNMGNALSSEGQPEEAEACYLKAIALAPEYAEAHNNIGVLLVLREELEKALVYFRRAVDLNHEYIDAIFNAGTTLKSLGSHTEALACFSDVITKQHRHLEARLQAANILSVHGDVDGANRLYEEVLQLSPENINALIGIAGAFLKKKDYQKAINFGNRAVRINSLDADALYCLGSAYLGSGDTGMAKKLFRKTHESSPTHVMAIYHLSTLGELQVPENFAPEYVANLFDKFSDTFDSHLLNDLEYRTPEHLSKAVKAVLSNRKNLNILDLGCGTGICGDYFRETARRLVGVDLSSKMLDKARSRNVYDALIIGELLEAFKQADAQYDLIIAADVFVYLGSLKPIFRAVAAALVPGGIFAFSIEKTDSQEPYILHKGGRYAHTIEYIHNLAREFEFNIVTIDDVILRKNEGKDVNGCVILLANH